LIIILTQIASVTAQQVKKYYDEGNVYFENGKYSEAIKKFSYVIKLNNDYRDVYLKRAMAYEKNNNLEEAASDYENCGNLYKNKSEHFYKAGSLYFQLMNYQKAIECLNKCTDIDKKNLEAYFLKIQAFLKLKNYEAALYESSQAIKIKKTSITYYYHGLSSFYLHDLVTAEDDYLKAIKLDIYFSDAFCGLAEVYYNLNKLDKALEHSNKAIMLNPLKAYYFLVRSNIYYKKNELNTAINDLSEILLRIEPQNIDILFLRAQYFEQAERFTEAINDYISILAIDQMKIIAIFLRAKDYEKINNKTAAIADYQLFITSVENNPQPFVSEISYARERIYQLNKESVNPEIKITWPVIVENSVIQIPDNKDSFTITGNIFDQSELKYFRINGLQIVLSEGYGIKKFSLTLSIKDIEWIILEAEDIYNNYEYQRFSINKTETNLPTIHLLNPYASDNGEIYLETNASTLFIEGKITDQSNIAYIQIDDIEASYKKDEINPVFSAMLKISNKSGFKIKVCDKYGNINEKSFYFNREGIKLMTENPMGKTWIVFIQNSSYEFLPVLKGPEKDVEKIKSAFSNYQINNFIIKKNMNKQEMQRFFLIELRDLIKNNNVTSLMIWFAGHGKYMNEMGYWLPVNALSNDEFTYFPVNSLKSSLQIYSPELKHILVVTDACEAGPAFTMVIRADTQEPDCSDWTYASLRSAQVLTSTSMGWASDQSVFADAFAESLKNNSKSCISIDQISQYVSQKVKESLKQTPVFGKIAGLEDEDGTFFFLIKAE